MKKRVNDVFLAKLQKFTANSMISASAVRNQGAPGVAKVARDYCGSLRLTNLHRLNRARFEAWLDEHTDHLQQRFPPGAQSWGAARKSINIFLRAATYTAPLAAHFRLRRLLPYLEVPLDSKVAAELKKFDRTLPPWTAIRALSPAVSSTYQSAASRDARLKRVHRADLDVFYWMP